MRNDTDSARVQTRQRVARDLKSILAANANPEAQGRRDNGGNGSMKPAPPPATRPTLRGGPGGVAHYWWVIVIAVVFAMGSTAFFARNQPPVFRADATLVLAPIDGLGTTRDVVDSLNTLDRRSVVATLATVPASRTVRQRARTELRLTGEQIRNYDVKTAVVPDTNVIEVTVEGPNPKLVAALAYAIAQQSIASTPQYYNIYALKALDWPTVPSQDVGPSLGRKMIAGTLFGLFVGFAMALFLSYVFAERLGSRLGQLPRRLILANGRGPHSAPRTPSATAEAASSPAPEQFEAADGDTSG